MRALLILLISFSGSGYAQIPQPEKMSVTVSETKIPKAMATVEITIPVGRLTPVPLTVDADEFEYSILSATDRDGLALAGGVREYDPDPKKLKLVVIGYGVGTAWVVVSSAKGGKLIPIQVVKLNIGPAPVPPGPDPKPPGPLPPGPIPGPDAEFTAQLQAAFNADLSTPQKKAEWLAVIKGFYVAVVDHAKSPKLLTVAEFQSDYRAAIPELLPADALVDLRKICGTRVGACCGTDASAMLDPTIRPRLVACLTLIAQTLAGVK